MRCWLINHELRCSTYRGEELAKVWLWFTRWKQEDLCCAVTAGEGKRWTEIQDASCTSWEGRGLLGGIARPSWGAGGSLALCCSNQNCCALLPCLLPSLPPSFFPSSLPLPVSLFIPLSLQNCSLGKILLSTHLAHVFAQRNLGKVKYKTMMTVFTFFL